MGTPLKNLDTIDTGHRFNGSSIPVNTAYDAQGNKTWLDENDELIAGIYVGMENEVYHALPAYSSSQMKTLVKQTPRHFYQKYISPVNRRRTSQTLQRTLDAGTHGHELILEPDGYYDRYYRDIIESDYPDALSTLKQMKDKCEELGIPLIKSADKARCIKEIHAVDPSIKIYDEIKAAHDANPEHVGKTAVDGVVWDDAHRVLASKEQHKFADLLVQDGLPEISFIAQCPTTGLWLKCRFDWLRFDCIAVDVKTTRSTEPREFARQAGNLGYHIQKAFYMYVASLLQVNISDFLFLCVEYVEIDWCEVFELDQEAKSMEKMLKGLLTLKHCLDNNEWRAYSETDTIRKINLPKYAI